MLYAQCGAVQPLWGGVSPPRRLVNILYRPVPVLSVLVVRIKRIFVEARQRICGRFTNWTKQVIATCITAFLQTIILYLGLLTYTQHALLAVGICLSATEVPRIAQMYELETSIKLNPVAISSTVSMGAKAAKFEKK